MKKEKSIKIRISRDFYEKLKKMQDDIYKITMIKLNMPQLTSLVSNQFPVIIFDNKKGRPFKNSFWNTKLDDYHLELRYKANNKK